MRIGILTQAQKANKQTQAASEEERVKLATSGALLKDNGEKITQENLEKELEKYFSRSDFLVTPDRNESGENGFIVTITENVEEGRKYFVSKSGIVENIANSIIQSELTDIFVSLYNDGTLVFSNNDELMEGKTLIKSYGNIKGKEFKVDLMEEDGVSEIPWTNEYESINKVVIENKIVPENMAGWFTNLINIQEIENIENIDTSRVVDMSYLFFADSNLKNIDLSIFDVSEVTDMSYMFYATSLESINLSGWNASKCTNMKGMFLNCAELKNADLSNFNAQNVTNMSYMFDTCTKLVNMDATNFNAENVTNMSHMFYNCYALLEIDFSSITSENVVNMDNMFGNCIELTNVNLSNLSTRNSDMSNMFVSCTKLTTVKFNESTVSTVSNMYQMFWGCEALTNVNLNNFDTSNVTNMAYVFAVCRSLTEIDISNWEIPSNISVYGMFGVREVTTTVYVKNDTIKTYLENNVQGGSWVIYIVK